LLRSYVKNLSPVALFWLLSLLVLAVRLVAASQMELMEDEAYYWLWSRDPQLSYYDHPAMVAWLIRGGTMLLGDTPLAIRLPAILLNIATARVLMAVGCQVFGQDRLGARLGLIAACWFYAMLLFNVTAIIMTPDAPLLFCWSLLLLAATRILTLSPQHGASQYWALLGLAAGLGALSKYPILLMAPPLLAMLLTYPELRRWLRRPHPYIALLIALLVATPLLWWNATHGWIGINKQWNHAYGSRTPQPLRWLGELVGSELGVVTPLVLLALLLASWWGLRQAKQPAVQLLALSSLLPLAFFLTHCLSGRVQAHWPAPAYLAACVLVPAWLKDRQAQGRRLNWLGWAAPASAAVLSLVLYSQAVHPWLPIPQSIDPTRRLSGWAELGRGTDQAYQQSGADFLLAPDYTLASQLSFYMPQHPMVWMPDMGRRLPFVGGASIDQLVGKNALYITRADGAYDQSAALLAHFDSVTPLAPPLFSLTLMRDGQDIRWIHFYLAKGYRGGLIEKP
jgi:4-amino-4-deoxy-L-arabinose transferase-like glycosyltransferase